MTNTFACVRMCVEVRVRVRVVLYVFVCVFCIRCFCAVWVGRKKNFWRCVVKNKKKRKNEQTERSRIFSLVCVHGDVVRASWMHPRGFQHLSRARGPQSTRARGGDGKGVTCQALVQSWFSFRVSNSQLSFSCENAFWTTSFFFNKMSRISPTMKP